MAHFLITFSALFCTLLLQLGGSPSLAEDRDNEVNVMRVAEEICATGGDVASQGGFKNGFGLARPKQVSRPSTIVKLSDLFHKILEEPESLQGSKHLLECAKNNRSFLAKLREMVEVSNKNVCSNKKLLLIDEIHRNYISTVVGDKQLAPEVEPGAVANSLRLFFMHYAMEVSAICKLGLINNLEWDLKEIGFKEEYYNFKHGGMKDIIDRMESSLGAMTSVENYDDIILIWDIIDSFSGFASDKFQRAVDERSGEEIRMYVKTGNSEPLLEVQERCRAKFRPIYEKLILPIITLADIGYSCDGERFEKEIKELYENKLVQEWYILTQVCESILPIKFLQDKTMPLNGKVSQISKEEADQLAKSQEQPEVEMETPIEYEPTTNVFASRDYLESVETEEANRLVNRVQLNINSRNNGIRRVLRRLIRQAIEFYDLKLNGVPSFPDQRGDVTDFETEEAFLFVRGLFRAHLAKELEREQMEKNPLEKKPMARIWSGVQSNMKKLIPSMHRIVDVLSAIILMVAMVVVVGVFLVLGR